MIRNDTSNMQFPQYSCAEQNGSTLSDLSLSLDHTLMSRRDDLRGRYISTYSIARENYKKKLVKRNVLSQVKREARAYEIKCEKISHRTYWRRVSVFYNLVGCASGENGELRLERNLDK